MSLNSQTPISIAIIGGGQIGPRHALSVLASPLCTLTALVDPAPHGAATAASLGVSHFSTISALLSSNQKPTAALVCTPNHTHVSVAKELCSAGIHVLVEKPLATSIEDGKSLIEHARKCNVKLLAGHHRRFNPYITATKAALNRNIVGRVLAVSGVWALYKPTSYFEGNLAWHCDASAGTILINLVHDIDLLQYLLGPIIRVQAEQAAKTRGNDADEGAAVIFKFANGIVGTFIVSDATPSPWTFESGTGENPIIPKVAVEDGAGGFYRILGTEGSLSVPDMKVWKYGGPVMSWTEELETEAIAVDEKRVPFDSQVEQLCRVIRGEEEPVCTGEQGLSALIVCEAVRTAIDSGQAVEVEQVV